MQQGSYLGILILTAHIVLTDSLKSNVLISNQDSHWLGQSSLSNLKNLFWHSGREETNLGSWINASNNLVDLLNESKRQHLISLIDNQQLDLTHVNKSLLNHSLYLSWGSNDHMTHFLESLSLSKLGGSSNEKSNFDLHKLRQLLSYFVDLDGKFSCWKNDKYLLLFKILINVLESAD